MPKGQPQDPLARSTVEALKNTLDQYPDDALIVLSMDAEGNDYHLLDGVDPEAEWNTATNFIVEDEGREKGRPCIILIPEH